MSKKRKFTFNVIDALIILFLVALIAFIVYFFILGKDFDFNDEGDLSTEKTENTEQSTIKNEAVSNADIIGDGIWKNICFDAREGASNVYRQG